MSSLDKFQGGNERPILEVMAEHGVEVPDDQSWPVMIHCPFPDHEDSNPSFAVYEDNHWHCYGCDRGGGALYFVRAMYPDKVEEECRKLSLTKAEDLAHQIRVALGKTKNTSFLRGIMQLHWAGQFVVGGDPHLRHPSTLATLKRLDDLFDLEQYDQLSEVVN